MRRSLARMKAAKPAIMQRQMALLNERYDLSKRVSDEVKMTRGKPIPVGPAARLAGGLTWEALGAMSPDEIREKGLFPKGFLPLPHPNHPEGGMVFPKMMIDELDQNGRRAIGWNGSTSISTCPTIFCRSSRRRSS